MVFPPAILCGCGGGLTDPCYPGQIPRGFIISNVNVTWSTASTGTIVYYENGQTYSVTSGVSHSSPPSLGGSYYVPFDPDYATGSGCFWTDTFSASFSTTFDVLGQNDVIGQITQQYTQVTFVVNLYDHPSYGWSIGVWFVVAAITDNPAYYEFSKNGVTYSFQMSDGWIHGSSEWVAVQSLNFTSQSMPGTMNGNNLGYSCFCHDYGTYHVSMPMTSANISNWPSFRVPVRMNSATIAPVF